MTKGELTLEVLEKYKNLTQQDWLDKIKYRGLEHKFVSQLKELSDFYPEKITRVMNSKFMPDPEATAEENEKQRLEFEQYKIEKIERLKDKFAAVIKETEFRKERIVKRKPIGTVYYIDYVNGDDANDGLSTSTAWKTLKKYTTTTVRSAGDIAYVRANQTHTYNTADVVFDEDGNANNYISLIGCNASQGIDPWNDSSDVKPIISFGDAAYQVNLKADNFWYFKNLEFIESNDSNGIFYIYNLYGSKIENCVFRDAYASGVEGLYIKDSRNVELINCEFRDNLGINLYIERSEVNIKNCIFNGGSATTDYGIKCIGATIFISDSTFGATTNHDLYDIYTLDGTRVYTRNCLFNKGNKVVTGTTIYSEDIGQTFGSHKTEQGMGIIDKETSVVHSGGASSSAKMSPNSYCGLNYPLTLGGNPFLDVFKVWCPASTTTITIYIRGFGWTTFPTASELYIEASYLDSASAATRSTVVSNDVLTDNTTWTAFDVTFTPAREGWVYVTVYLKKYTANCGVYVDIKPIVS